MTEPKKNNVATTLKWVVILVAAFLVILFAIQNSDPVELGLIFGKRMVPLSAIMILVFLVGFLVGVFLMMTFISKHRKKNKHQASEIERLENRLDSVQKKMMDIDEELKN